MRIEVWREIILFVNVIQALSVMIFASMIILHEENIIYKVLALLLLLIFMYLKIYFPLTYNTITITHVNMHLLWGVYNIGIISIFIILTFKRYGQRDN